MLLRRGAIFFSRSYVIFEGRIAKTSVGFEPNWGFRDCYSSLITPMATKWWTKLDIARERWPIVCEGHPSNFKVSRLQNRRFDPDFIQTQNKENTKAPRHWSLSGAFTEDRWIPRTNGQLRGKFFHLMTSSWNPSDKPCSKNVEFR